MKARIVGWGGLMLSVALSLWSRPVSAEPYVLVKVSEIDRTTASQVISATDLKELDKTIQTEKKYFQLALQAAAKAWREDELNKNTAFPAGRLSPRSIVGSPERFESQEKAEAQQAKYYERDAKKEDREREKAKTKVTKTRDDADREKKKESEAARAMELVKAKLSELMAGKPGAGAPEAGAPAGGAEKKGDAKANEKAPDAEKKAGAKLDAAKVGAK